jgi:hypothetical protein
MVDLWTWCRLQDSLRAVKDACDIGSVQLAAYSLRHMLLIAHATGMQKYARLAFADIVRGAQKGLFDQVVMRFFMSFSEGRWSLMPSDEWVEKVNRYLAQYVGSRSAGSDQVGREVQMYSSLLQDIINDKNRDRTDETAHHYAVTKRFYEVGLVDQMGAKLRELRLFCPPSTTQPCPPAPPSR